ncbi:MAG: glycosyltransferase family 4 protein [Thaumarchaeota archaeon]|nr:glycosyltransferase family 4 protein [Nitrososphaerota archaeon]
MPLGVALLTWEFPPRIVGEMAYYTERLAKGLVEEKVDVTVVTFHDAPYLKEQFSDRLVVHRLPNPVGPHVSVVTWALSLTAEVQRILSNVRYDESRRIDLVDVHEWQFAVAAIGLKKALDLPFVLTLHSLEAHRSQSLSSPLSSCINGLEWLGASECELLLARSTWMKSEVERVHKLPTSKIRVVAQNHVPWLKQTLQAYRDAVDLTLQRAEKP